MTRPLVMAERSRGFLATYVWLIVAMMALCLAAAFSVARSEPTSYTSAARVLVEPMAKAGVVATPPNMGTEQAIATSRNVVGQTAAQLGVPEKTVFARLTVTVSVTATVLEFGYTAPSAAMARTGAAAASDTYVAERNGGPSGTRAVVARVISPPALPHSPDAPDYALILGLSLALGALVGVGAALLWDRSSDRLRGAEDVREQTGLPVLANVPDFTEPPTLSGSGYSSAEAREVYGHLATQLPISLRARWGVSLLVTSASRGAGKSTTAAQLAVSLALMGKDVVLVEADVRNPVLEHWFWLPPGPGLNEVLAGKVPLEQALRGTDYDHLQVLTAGARSVGPNLTFDLEDIQLLIGRLQRGALVIVDAPTCTEAAETAQLATEVDHVLLVCDVRRGLRTDARAAVGALNHVRDKISGAVANRPAPGRSEGGDLLRAASFEKTSAPPAAAADTRPVTLAPSPSQPRPAPPSARTDT
ncbi:MAG: nucleotide-binding protein [Nocardioidaceae bacterium]